MVTDSDSGQSSLFEAALDALDLAVLIHDNETILFANRATRMGLNSEGSSLVGLPVREIVHPDARPAGEVRRALVLSLGQELTNVPVKLHTFDGRVRYARANARRIRWNGGEAIMVVGNFIEQP
jgi:PAS domain S-box-containing protein